MNQDKQEAQPRGLTRRTYKNITDEAITLVEVGTVPAGESVTTTVPISHPGFEIQEKSEESQDQQGGQPVSELQGREPDAPNQAAGAQQVSSGGVVVGSPSASVSNTSVNNTTNQGVN